MIFKFNISIRIVYISNKMMHGSIILFVLMRYGIIIQSKEKDILYEKETI